VDNLVPNFMLRRITSPSLGRDSVAHFISLSGTQRARRVPPRYRPGPLSSLCSDSARLESVPIRCALIGTLTSQWANRPDAHFASHCLAWLAVPTDVHVMTAWHRFGPVLQATCTLWVRFLSFTSRGENLGTRSRMKDMGQRGAEDARRSLQTVWSQASPGFAKLALRLCGCSLASRYASKGHGRSPS
jgi:hypothetical protein